MTPLVCCICPSHIPGYLERAKACFDAQTYPNKAWLGVNTSGLHMTVGGIRNKVLREAPAADLVAHFDHDDWSHPLRLAEQVEFIERMGCQVVGYGDMPFYDVERDKVLFYDSRNPHYALGTSLMYRREVWERTPFPDQTPEDTTWQNLIGPSNVFSCSSVAPDGLRMAQTIHKRNACPKSGSRFQPASAEMERAVRDIVGQCLV